MLSGEGYLICNALLCGCALPLGGKLAGLPAPQRGRLLLAAGIGGIAALAGLWMPGCSLLSLPVCVWLSFGRNGRAACLRCTVTTLCASLMIGGAMWALMERGIGTGGALGLSIALTLFFYLLASLLPSTLCEVRQVEIGVGEHSVLLPAMVDSGNLLRDPVTALPVLVIPLRAAFLLYPDAEKIDALTSLPVGFRLLHVHTAAGNAMLPLFRPDRCWLYLNGQRQETRLMAAVAGPEYRGTQALVPLCALGE